MEPTTRKQRAVQQRENDFLEVARKILIEQGFSGLNMERVAEATEYSRGTIYQHFKTKEDMVMALASLAMDRRASLIGRLASFEGCPRERIHGVGIADELFVRLYPHSFRSELIIKMADLGDRASPERRDLLRAQEERCAKFVLGFIEDAVKTGDLNPDISVSRVMFAILSMVMGTHTLTSTFGSLLDQIGITKPFSALRENIHILLDGFGWKPLSSDWDYAATDRRILQEVYADEYQSVGIGIG
jgi:AcrR family transcriptional regulator